MLYVTLRAHAKNGEAAISDCRRVEFPVIIKDNSIFRMSSGTEFGIQGCIFKVFILGFFWRQEAVHLIFLVHANEKVHKARGVLHVYLSGILIWRITSPFFIKFYSHSFCVEKLRNGFFHFNQSATKFFVSNATKFIFTKS